MIYSAKQIERFWQKVKLGQHNECWPWTRSLHSNGYGQVGMTDNGVSRILKAHRIAWSIAHGKSVPAGMRVLHSCGEKPCCNPDHLYLSSASKDKPKGHARGQAHGHAKLTDEQVSMVKYRLTRLSTRQIATLLGVRYNAIWDIRQGKTWGHI